MLSLYRSGDYRRLSLFNLKQQVDNRVSIIAPQSLHLLDGFLLQWNWFTLYAQARSQALSSLPVLVVERKTLVAASHMTTQNLGGTLSWLLLWRTLWVSKPQAVAKNYPLVTASANKVCRWRILHYFCRPQNVEDFHSQENSAAEWSSNLSTVSTCKVRYRMEVKLVDQISLLKLWIFR